jgi:hypothetical protein
MREHEDLRGKCLGGREAFLKTGLQLRWNAASAAMGESAKFVMPTVTAPWLLALFNTSSTSAAMPDCDMPITSALSSRRLFP